MTEEQAAQAILRKVAKRYRLAPALIVSPTKRAYVTRARDYAALRMRRDLEMKYSAIAVAINRCEESARSAVWRAVDALIAEQEK